MASSILSTPPRSPNKANSNGGSNGKRKSSSLPNDVVEYLKAWMMSPEHIAHPYPTEQEKAQIMKETGIELKQLTNWFVNNRKRYWKPRVEARLQQQAQAAAVAVQAHAATVAAVTAAAQQAHATVFAASNNSNNNDCGNDHAAAAASFANLVSPEAAFKPTMTVQPPAGNGFVSFDLETPSKKLQQQLNQQQHHLHHAFSPASLAVQLLSQTALQRNESSTASTNLSAPSATRAVSEVSSSNSSSASVSASEGELSDTSPEDLDDAVVVTSFKKSPVKLLSMNSNYARNVSFCSLEQVSGEASGEESSSSISKEESISCSSTITGKEDAITLIPTTKTSSYKTSNKRRSSSSSTVAPRKKYRRVSLDLWIDACRNAPHNNDESLPSLEEASRLFGYSK